MSAGSTLLFCRAGMWSFLWRRDLVAGGQYRCVASDPPGPGPLNPCDTRTRTASNARRGWPACGDRHELSPPATSCWTCGPGPRQSSATRSLRSTENCYGASPEQLLIGTQQSGPHNNFSSLLDGPLDPNCHEFAVDRLIAMTGNSFTYRTPTRVAFPHDLFQTHRSLNVRRYLSRNLEEEIADVFAWIVAAANCLPDVLERCTQERSIFCVG